MATAKVKFGDRVLRLRPQSLTTNNIAMIFKLDINRGIYLNCEEEGEIILPSTDSAGLFEIENFDKVYVVNGDLASTERSPSTCTVSALASHVPTGVPLSYQPVTQRYSLNPPPCGPVASNSTLPTLQRPRFTSSVSAGKRTMSGWKKAFTVVDVDRMGNITEKFQIHLQLSENIATVNGIQDLLKGQLGFNVTLLDSKCLPVMPGESTKGKNICSL